MNRRYIIFFSILAACAGMVIALMTAFCLSSHTAVNEEQQRLTLFAGRAVARAGLTLDSARTVLLSARQFTARPCSDDHIQEMRLMVINAKSIEEMGYFESGLLKCTSWGITTATVVRAAPGFTLADGIQVTLHMKPTVTMGKRMTALHLGSYNVLIDPVRFADIVLEPDMRLAVMTGDGHVFGTQRDPDIRLSRSLLHGARGTDAGPLSVVVRGTELHAVVTEPHANVRERIVQQQWLIMPFGALAAVIVIGIVIWLARRRLSLLGELGVAIERRELSVHYQPLLHMRSGNCIGAEALVRWSRADGSAVRPDLFIPLAERNGLIQAITDHVIHTVINDFKVRFKTEPDLHIAINVSAEDIKTGRFLNVLEQGLREAGIAASHIWLEMTERGLIDVDAARITIGRARTAGHAVAIDDFGTGYSSLSCLQELPLDALKIDKSFIKVTSAALAGDSVTPHIVAMARTLHLKIVAEGIETQEQADYLQALGVELGQGWLYGKAMPLAEFLAFYQRCNADRAG